MAGSLNKVTLIGRLGSDPEMKYTKDNTAFVNMSIATSNKFKGKDGEWNEKTEWHRIVVWGKQAENCSNYLHKGSNVCVEGSLETRSWDTESGEKKYMTQVKAFSVIFLDPKGNNGNQSNGDSGPEDDLPF